MTQQLERVTQREVPPQLTALPEDHAHPPGERTAAAPGSSPADSHVAGCRHEHAGEHLDGGGLPRAVRPDVADHLAPAGPRTDTSTAALTVALVRRTVQAPADGRRLREIAHLDTAMVSSRAAVVPHARSATPSAAIAQARRRPTGREAKERRGVQRVGAGECTDRGSS